MSTFIWLLIILAAVLFALKIGYALAFASVLPFTRGATYVSTSQKRISAFLDAVPMDPGQLFIDLGCGDGRVLRGARNRYGVRAVGYELNPWAYLKARLLCLGRRGIEVRWRNFFNAELSGADVLFCYLFPDVMAELSRKLKSELRPKAVVVSCNFSLPGFTPHRVIRPEGALHHDPIYIYGVEDPLKSPG